MSAGAKFILHPFPRRPDMKVGIVGLGEAGEAMTVALLREGHAVCCHDDRLSSSSIATAVRLGIPHFAVASQFSDAIEIVLVTVQARDKFLRLAPALLAGTIYADCTAKSVEARDAIARGCGDRALVFCDIAIADTVSWPDRTVELLASGAGTNAIASLFTGTRFLVRVVDAVRHVSAELKLLRSAYTKGLTALILETLCAAQKCGTRDEIQRSVTSFMQEDFSRIASMLVGSSIKHARRRADEMRDARRLLDGLLGCAPMTAATSAVLDGIAQAGLTSPADTLESVIEELHRSQVFHRMSDAATADH
jgi:3-hydroxyisobutyrate dehydrogenase